MTATVLAVLAAISLFAAAFGYATVFAFGTMPLGLALFAAAYAVSRIARVP